MALVGFVTTSYLFSEIRPQENIDVRLFTGIVSGRSVIVDVNEQSMYTVLNPYTCTYINMYLMAFVVVILFYYDRKYCSGLFK